MLPVLNVGGVAIQTRGLLFLAAFWLGLQAADLVARRLELNPDDLWNAGFAGLIAGLLGARLFYVVQFIDVYVSDPSAVLALNLLDMNWWAGALAAVIAAGVYLWNARVPLMRAADASVVGVAVAWSIAALGAFFSGDAYGVPTSLPWAVEMVGAPRHPVQLYEFVAGLVVAGVLWHLVRKREFDGWLALVGVALLAGARLVVEAFRATPATIGDGFRIVQVGAWIVLLVTLAVLAWQQHRKPEQSIQRV